MVRLSEVQNLLVERARRETPVPTRTTEFGVVPEGAAGLLHDTIANSGIHRHETDVVDGCKQNSLADLF
jgi:hypothetical protein